MFTFSADIDGLNQLLTSMDHLEKSADDLPMERIAQLLLDSVQENFRQEGRPRWESRQKDYPWPILDKTGNLKNSIYSEISGDEVLIGAGASYGRYHDQGTSRLPARPFLEMQPEDEDAIVNLIWDSLNL